MSEGNPAPDPVAAYLDEVRGRAALIKPSAHGYTPRGEQLPGGPADDWLIANLTAAADVPLLLAAVEAVLKAHRPYLATGGKERCTWCRTADGTHELWTTGGCPEYQAMSRALLGEESPQ